MAKYELTDAAWLPLASDGGSVLCKAGQVIEWSGWPAACMDPLDDEARGLKTAVAKLRNSSGGLTISIDEWRKQQQAAHGTTRGQA
jgi:hypothetical protein